MHEAVAAELAAERRRQVEQEGWFPAHDDGHAAGELAMAAAAYAAQAAGNSQIDVQIDVTGVAGERTYRIGGGLPARVLWPWGGWWKPKTPREDLVRAGALIIAEIERLDRAAARAREGGANA